MKGDDVDKVVTGSILRSRRNSERLVRVNVIERFLTCRVFVVQNVDPARSQGSTRLTAWSNGLPGWDLV